MNKNSKWNAALRDASLSALSLLVLSFPILGLHANEENGATRIRLRLPLVFTLVALAFVGRLIKVIWLDSAKGSPSQASLTIDDAVREGDRFKGIPPPATWVRALTWVLPMVALVFPFLPGVKGDLIDVATAFFIYVMLGWGLNIVVGLAGLLDLGYVGFYAIGAYSYAILAKDFHFSFWACLPLAGVFAATFGVLLGFPVLRLRGDYLAIVTLGFGEIIRIVLINWQDFSGGPDGILGIPGPTLMGHPFTENPPEGVQAFHQVWNLEFAPEQRMTFLYYIILVLSLLTSWFTVRMRKLPVGRAWEALREDETACQSLGINPTAVKLSAFAIGAMFAGFAGSFFSTRQGFISPESFVFIESAIILAIVVLGGMGSQLGIVFSSFVLVVVPEIIRRLPGMLPNLGEDSPVTRFAEDFAATFPDYRMLVFGFLMVVIMVWKPQGLLSHREPSHRLFAWGQKGKASEAHKQEARV